MQGCHKNMKIDEQELLKLKAIVDAIPNYYVDKMALVFGIDTVCGGRTMI